MAHTRRRNYGIAGRQNRDHGRSDARYRQVGFADCAPAVYISEQRCNKGVQLEMHPPPEKVVERWEERAKAAVFFMHFALADIPKIAVENPVGFMNSAYRKPDMVIHPYQFATGTDDAENYHKKRTCLWTKGLPELMPTADLPEPNLAEIYGRYPSGKTPCWEDTVNGKDRAKLRSKTFPGIAAAMAEQWGSLI